MTTDVNDTGTDETISRERLFDLLGTMSRSLTELFEEETNGEAVDVKRAVLALRLLDAMTRLAHGYWVRGVLPRRK
jgi:hypothetical protein